MMIRSQAGKLDSDDQASRPTNTANSNLTAASWVIFFSPFFKVGTDAHERYHATMRQAIGRARRFGQPVENVFNGQNIYRKVKILHFLTAFTMDVDLHEERTRKQVTKRSLRGENDGTGERLTQTTTNTAPFEPEVDNIDAMDVDVDNTTLDRIAVDTIDVDEDNTKPDRSAEPTVGVGNDLQAGTEVGESSHYSSVAEEVDKKLPLRPGRYASMIAHLVLGRDEEVRCDADD